MNKIKWKVLAGGLFLFALSQMSYAQDAAFSSATEDLNAKVQALNDDLSNHLTVDANLPENQLNMLSIKTLQDVNATNLNVLNQFNLTSVSLITDAVAKDITANQITNSDIVALQFARNLDTSILLARKVGQSKIIFVNISDFTLYALNTNDGSIVFESEVIVGKKHKQTPLFSTNIVSLTVNPTWTPTPSILKASVYPSIGKPKGYAGRTGMVAVQDDGTVLDLSDPNVSKEDVQGLKIYQPAGEDNALGLIRFNTDNKEDIYLHDTNERSLFKKDSRAYSHGCVRVQEWNKLALWLTEWQPDDLQTKIDTNDTTTYRVNKTQVNIVNYPIKVNDNGITAMTDVYAD